MKGSYEQLRDGDTFLLRKKSRICCCSCGLVHDWKFKIVDGEIVATARQNSKATRIMRNKMGWMVRWNP